MIKIIPLGFLFFIFAFSSQGYSVGNRDEYLKVAILGTGKKYGDPEEYEQEILAKLLRRIKDEKPDLVFFTGNLIQGLEQNTTPEGLKAFEENLRHFSNMTKTYLGEIPLYAVMGNHTFVNSEAVEIFKKHFQIKNPAPLESYQLAYSLTERNVTFTVLATGEYERKYRGSGYYSRSMPILDWLEKNVRSGGEDIDFRFVIGHEPAFSSESTGGIYTGFEKSDARKDQFWKTLRQNKVLGYFCSHELIYDRSNRNGVWQIVSGGVGDPKKFKNEEHMFQHFIVLSIPRNARENPQVKTIDINGRLWDDFILMPVDRPVHHLRISQN
jgi:hypothetical protein